MLENTDKLIVTLEAQEWNQVLFILDEIPMPKRVTVPLAAKVTQQLKQQEDERGGRLPGEALSGEALAPVRGNGLAREVN